LAIRRTFVITLAAAGVVTALVGSGPASAQPAAETVAPSSTLRVGSDPESIAVAPDGRRAYVANSGGSTVSVIDTAASRVATTFRVDGYPTSVGVSPDSSRVYVTSGWENTLSTLDASTGRVVSRTKVGDYPGDLVVAPDGSRVYVVNGNSENVSVVDTTTGRVTARIPVGGLTETIAINPAGTFIYAVVTATPSAVKVIDTTSNRIVGTIRIGRYAWAMAVSPDGSRGYVSTAGGLGGNGAVDVLDLSAGTVTARIPVGLQPTDLELNADGTTLYVANQGSGFVGGRDPGSNALVSAVDTATLRVTGTIELAGAGIAGRQVVALALNPVGGLAYGSLGSSRRVATFDPLVVPRTPTQPQSVSHTVSGRSITVRWLAPADQGGSAVTNYVVTAVPIVEGPAARVFTCASTGTTCRLTGLPRSLSYAIQVQARNAEGWGPVAIGRLATIR
jgi:YVTN family beta-propeller protein